MALRFPRMHEFHPFEGDRSRLSKPLLLTLLSLDFARTGPRSRKESTWYGTYSEIFHTEFSGVSDGAATFAIPQLPITVDVPENDEDDEDEGHEQKSRDPHSDFDGVPDSPTPIGRMQRTHSIESLMLHGSQVGQADASYSPESEARAHASTTPGPDATAKELRTFRSQRVPDFVGIRLYLDSRLEMVNSRVEYVAELKRPAGTESGSVLKLAKALFQATDQAMHVFIDDPKLTGLIYIVAAGPVMSYGSLDRDDVLGKDHPGIVNPNRDSTYEPSSPSPTGIQSPASSREFSYSLASDDAILLLPKTLKVDLTVPEGRLVIEAIKRELEKLDLDMNGLYTNNELDSGGDFMMS
ncbi:hypothetical protein BDN72DRAFT_893232 [Pluteus cervinus]|uniref:Uncharacterized protein n=1 Tax=Pluteus cervinus TaxID=181527 RepID=A0ACD3B8J8_9AGAR|nr:hypothetical protein BDN72DRAFT_893232 [Pluteus cervinus]